MARNSFYSGDAGAEVTIDNSVAAAALSETNAATSETNAATSETNAATSATAAAASYDSFDDRYLGTKSSDPTVDNDSATLVDGALYFNTSNNVMMVYDLGNTTWNRTTPTTTSQGHINTVSGIAANVTTVAGKSTEVGLLGVSGVITNMGLLGTSAAVADMAILGTSDIVADMAILATPDIVTDMSILGTADIVEDMSILGTAAVVEDMSILATSDIVEDLSILATSDIVTDMSILATAAIVEDMSILATSDIVEDMSILGTAAVVEDLSILGTAAVVEDLSILGTAAVVEDLSILATSDIVTDMSILATSDIVTDMSILATPDIVTDMSILGTAAIVEDMSILGTADNVSNMNTVADNISSVNSFAARYRVASSAPNSSLDEGDLYFNTTDNKLYHYNGSAWVEIKSYSVQDGELSQVSFTTADNTKLDGIEDNATADQTAAQIKTHLENGIDSVHYVDGSIDLVHMSANSVDSDQYVDGSIDTVHIDDLQVTTAKIAADAITTAKIADDVALGGNPTTTTQSVGNNTTRIATTAYTDAQVATIVDSAPGTLNTLNELAAALGDDADFSTTTATNIAAKLPKAGGEMSGNITMAGSQTVDGRDLSVDGAKLDLIAASANAYVHPTSAGNVHIPSGGSAGQILRYASAGTAAWGTDENDAVAMAIALG